MAKTVADLVIERLIGWGVHTIFGLPGDGINGLFEALRTHQDALQFIQVRHAEAARAGCVGFLDKTKAFGDLTGLIRAAFAGTDEDALVDGD